LLTVISIIGILAAIIIPVAGKARRTAERAQAVTKLRQIIIATMAYGSENKGQPPYPEWNSGIPGFRGTPHAYALRAWDETIKPWLGDRYTALYTSRAIAELGNDLNPDAQRKIEASGGTPKQHVHFCYFHRIRAGVSYGRAKPQYELLFKNLNNPPQEYAIWGTLTYKSPSSTMNYAEASNTRTIPLSGMFAGYADCSVKWFNFNQLVTFSENPDDAYYWPKPKNEP
jgi:general secretion pathway protein G